MRRKQDNAIIAAIIGGLFAVFAAVIGAMLMQPSGGGRKQNAIVPPSKTPPRTNNVADDSSASGEDEPARTQLRHQHNVRALEVAESDITLAKAPLGVYGFEMGYFLTDPSQIRLRRKFRKGYDYEYHKSSSGTTYILGYVGPETAARLNQDGRPKNLDVTIYADPWVNATNLVAIPLSQLASKPSRPRLIEQENGDFHALDLKLK